MSHSRANLGFTSPFLARSVFNYVEPPVEITDPERSDEDSPEIIASATFAADIATVNLGAVVPPGQEYILPCIEVFPFIRWAGESQPNFPRRVTFTFVAVGETEPTVVSADIGTEYFRLVGYVTNANRKRYSPIRLSANPLVPCTVAMSNMGEGLDQLRARAARVGDGLFELFKKLRQRDASALREICNLTVARITSCGFIGDPSTGQLPCDPNLGNLTYADPNDMNAPVNPNQKATSQQAVPFSSLAQSSGGSGYARDGRIIGAR